MFSTFKALLGTFSRKENIVFFVLFFLFLTTLVTRAVFAFRETTVAVAAPGGTYKEGALFQPNIINPVFSSRSIDEDLSALLFSPLSELLFGVKVSEDGRTYTITLKEDLHWDDGQALTSDDVLFTVQTIQNPLYQSHFQKSYSGITLNRLSELQVEILLTETSPVFLDRILRLRIIPYHVFGSLSPGQAQFSEYALRPVGSGPYRFQSFSRRADGFIENYRLIPNEYYIGQQPFIEDFWFVFFEREEDLLHAFQSREIDGFFSADLPEDVLSFSEDSRIELPSVRHYAVFFNPVRQIAFQSKDVRKALGLSIDRRRLVEEATFGVGRAITSPFLEVVTNSSSSPMEEAKELWEKADNDELVFTLLVPEVPFLERTAQILREDWLKMGLADVRIEVVSKESLSLVLQKREYDAILFGNVPEDPYDLFPFWHSSERVYPGFNISGYSSSRMDVALQSVREEGILSERQNLFSGVTDILEEDVPAVFLYTLPFTYFSNEDVSLAFATTTPAFYLSPSHRFVHVDQWAVNTVRVVK